MVELVDTLVLGTSAFGRGGSTPSRGTTQIIENSPQRLLVYFIIFCYLHHIKTIICFQSHFRVIAFSKLI